MNNKIPVVKNFNKFTLNTFNKFAHISGGGDEEISKIEEVVGNFEKHAQFEDLPWGDLPIGHITKILKNLNSPLIDSIIYGNVNFEPSSDGKTLVLSPYELVDNTGRFLPFGSNSRSYQSGSHSQIKNTFCMRDLLDGSTDLNANCTFLKQSHERYFGSIDATQQQINDRIQKLYTEVIAQPEYANLVIGPGVPIIISKQEKTSLQARITNLFGILKDTTLGMPLIMNLKTEMTLKNFEESYQIFLERMHSESIIALYFAQPFLGFSPEEQLRISKGLPKGFVIGGPIDGLIARIVFPDLFYKEMIKNRLACQFPTVGIYEHHNALTFLYNDDEDQLGFELGLYSSPTKPLCRRSAGLLYIGTEQ